MINCPKSRHLPWWKKLLFSLLVTVGFFVALELLLALGGVRPVLRDEDPFVGFAARIPLFVEQADADGRVWMVTAENRRALFNLQRFPQEKAAGTFRVFCLGGSTTYGHPYDDTVSFAGWLRELLPAADRSRNWEVINCGGISYASYRVTLLMEELAEYEPDLFIVYSGHNEFLERRTYRAMLDQPRSLLNLQALLARTRIYALLRRLLRREDGPRIGGANFSGSSTATDDTRPDARDLLPAEVAAVLDRTVGPESYHRDDSWTEHVLAHYELSLEHMISLADGCGARILFVTPASNLRDFSPFKSEHRAGLTEPDRDLWLGHLDVAGEAFQTEQFADALAALDAAAKIDDRHARLHFLRGRVLMHLQRYDQARAAFEQARDEDICPLRAPTRVRQIVLDVARRQQRPVVDFVELIDRRSDHRLPGDDWFLDHVHPTIEGYRLLSLAILDELARTGLVAPESAWGEEAIAEVKTRVESRLDSRAHANALRNLAKVMGWAGKFEQAAKLSLRAVEGLPDDAEAHLLAGRGWRRTGHPDRAIAEFERALKILPDFADAQLELGGLLVRAGRDAEAVPLLERAVAAQPTDALGQCDLGYAYLHLARPADAREQFLIALLLDPDLPAAHAGLAELAESDGNAAAAPSPSD